MLEGVDGQVVQRDGQRIQRDLAGSVEAVEKCFVESEDDRRWRRRPVLIDELGVLVRGLDSGHAGVEPRKNQSHLVKQEILNLLLLAYRLDQSLPKTGQRSSKILQKSVDNFLGQKHLIFDYTSSNYRIC